MQDKITDKKLEKYFEVTKKAIDKVKISLPSNIDLDKVANDFVDTAKRYYLDAQYFAKKRRCCNRFCSTKLCPWILRRSSKSKTP